MGRMLELRKELGLSQADVALAIGIGRTTYVGYERGTVMPPLDKAWRIADLYGTTIDYLVGRADKP